jgi:hypothetical protein
LAPEWSNTKFTVFDLLAIGLLRHDTIANSELTT